MKLRVIAGRELTGQYHQYKGLETIYSCSDFIVQADSTVEVIKEAGRIQAVIAGHLVGKRDSQGGLTAVDKNSLDFQLFMRSQPIDNCMDKLEGRFILIKINENQGFEICCDWYGQVDLYYQRVGEGMIFSSDLSMLPFKNSTVKYDQLGAAHSLYIYGFRPPKRHTLYADVKRLGVGEIALFKDSKISFKQLPPLIFNSNQEYGKEELNRYSDTMLDAVKMRGSSQGNLVYLSSGWDSTAILACLVHLFGVSKVKAVIGRFNFARRSGVNNPFELKRAQAVCDYFGVGLDIIDIDHYKRGPEIMERWETFMKSHMFSGMSVFLWSLMAEYAQTQGYPAVFSGEISDGVHNMGFSQHTTIFHPVIEFREYSDKMALYLFGPSFVKAKQNNNFENDVIYGLLRQKYKTGVFDRPENNSTGVFRQLFTAMFARSNRVPFWSLDNSRIFTGRGRQFYDETMAKEYFSEPAAAANPDTLYSWYIYLYNSFHWQGGTVLSLASAAQEKGVRMNLPFYDRRLQEFLAAMPEFWGRGLEIKPTKYPLKWMLENRIDYPLHLQVGPHSYLYDVNPEFNHAGEFIYASAYAPLIKEKLTTRSYQELLSPEIFNMEYINRIVNNYLAGKEIVTELGDLAPLAFLSLTGWY